MGTNNENQKQVTDEYRTAWDNIFGKKPETNIPETKEKDTKPIDR